MRNSSRCIKKEPEAPIFYIVDTCFLVYKFIDESRISNSIEKARALTAKNYWKRIDAQRKMKLAKVFVLDVCIAESFKILAKKYYDGSGIFPTSAHLDSARKRLSDEISYSAREARKSKRHISFHDIQTTRDLIIGVDRFFENAFKKRKNVGVIDLLILSTARYLIDFLGFDREKLYIITMDKALYELARSYNELPSAFNPDEAADDPKKVFV